MKIIIYLEAQTVKGPLTYIAPSLGPPFLACFLSAWLYKYQCRIAKPHLPLYSLLFKWLTIIVV